MNLHLFLDVVAYIWGVLFTLLFLAMMSDALRTADYDLPDWVKKNGFALMIAAILATTCWAWLVAG